MMLFVDENVLVVIHVIREVSQNLDQECHLRVSFISLPQSFLSPLLKFLQADSILILEFSLMIHVPIHHFLKISH